MANIVPGGPGNDVLYGNTVRASVSVIAFRCCCKNTKSFGRYEVDIDNLVSVNGVKKLNTHIAPTIVLVGTTSTDLLGLELPNQAALAHCPIICITIINCSDQQQLFHVDPQLSRLKDSDVFRIMEPECSYTFYYDKEKNFWFRSCVLGQVIQ